MWCSPTRPRPSRSAARSPCWPPSRTARPQATTDITASILSPSRIPAERPSSTSFPPSAPQTVSSACTTRSATSLRRTPAAGLSFADASCRPPGRFGRTRAATGTFPAPPTGTAPTPMAIRLLAPCLTRTPPSCLPATSPCRSPPTRRSPAAASTLQATRRSRPTATGADSAPTRNSQAISTSPDSS